MSQVRRYLKFTILALTAIAVSALVYESPADSNELPNRLPEAPPYVAAEARSFPPPFEQNWEEQDSPGQCRTCHSYIFNQWNGSMMSNAWRDPVWRAAFLLAARETSAYGECDTPQPPDGTPKARHNPFAMEDACASSFDIGSRMYKLSRPGSLLDGFCSRCHMPANYVDNVPLHSVKRDPETGMEIAFLDPKFNPTSDNGTGMAFATLDSQYRNTDAGKNGIFCAICHTFAETRDTPFHNYVSSAGQYATAPGVQSRSDLLPKSQQDMFQVPAQEQRNLGYSIGAGSFRFSPHAIGFPERLGPLAATQSPSPVDSYVSQVFGETIPFQHMDSSKHEGYYHVMFSRSEMCAACHDVTNALPIKNALGKWVGGFPIERTYTEWANSRYADRPGNANFDPRYKRDCQTCHMQQDYGQPGTAQTLYKNANPLPPLDHQVALDGPRHPLFTHHFVGGNAYVTQMIGADVDQAGSVFPYPELSTFSFSSADKNSPYANAYWTHTENRGAYVQQGRFAWERLRHVLSLEVRGPTTVQPGTTAPISVTVANTGSGHNFPTGFPEGRTAWLAIRAYDLATGKELLVHDSFWNRNSLGIGGLTTREMLDPNYLEKCHWKIPPGSADPYAVQFKAVASEGDGCPTLDLVYATPLNLVTNALGLPIDENGRTIDQSNSGGLPQFRDLNGNGDSFDDSYLKDTRLRPLPHSGAVAKVERYSIVIPPGAQGPVAVTAVVYYQTVEAVVAQKFLGNLADTNSNSVLEPCVLGGLCDGRKPSTEPAVVEGAPPVPMAVRNWVISVSGGRPTTTQLHATTYPLLGAADVYQDVVPKVFFSAPVTGVNAETFTLIDSRGRRVPASVDQIGDGTWGLFPNQVFLKGGQTYLAQVRGKICSAVSGCVSEMLTWRFTVAATRGAGTGDTSVPSGFSPELP